MTAIRKVAAVVFGVVAVIVLVILSQVPYSVDRSDSAALRLSWRLRTSNTETCRVLTAEELQDVPIHMRQEEVCEVHPIPYRLSVLIDDEMLIDRPVEASGTRSDRPLYVFEEVRVAPGDRQVQIMFVSELATEGDQEPIALALSRRLRLDAREITLITYDEAAGELVVR